MQEKVIANPEALIADIVDMCHEVFDLWIITSLIPVITPQPLYNTELGFKAEAVLVNRVISKQKCLDYIEKGP